MQPRPGVANRALCATVSTASHESLTATASRIDNWIVLEYRALWDRDVLGASRFTPELKAHLREQLHALAPARLLFVKKPERRAYGRRHVWVVEGGGRALLPARGRPPGGPPGLRLRRGPRRRAPGMPVNHPLLVVCTHGKRDRCCAKNGGPLHDALRHETESSWVWQSTHVGGDRFAGNVVMLPHGLYYGRVEPDVQELLEAHASGRIDMEHYRGRAAHSFPVQAAEHAIRESEGLVGSTTSSSSASARSTTAGGSVPQGCRRARGGRRLRALGEPVFLTCGAAEPRRARHYFATALGRL